jgi:hypothetical protein
MPAAQSTQIPIDAFVERIAGPESGLRRNDSRQEQASSANKHQRRTHLGWSKK